MILVKSFLKMVTKKKIQVNFSVEAQKEIDELKQKLNLGSLSDVIRSSLKLTKYIELQKDLGNEIIIRNIKTKKEKEIVFMK